MTAKAFAAIAAAILIAALPLPTAAAAPTRRGGGKHNPTVIASLALRGSNGYTVGVSLVNRRNLSVTAFAEGPDVVGAGYGYSLDAPQTGTFVGRIAFRGEDGYTKARATRVFGSVLTAPASACRKPKGHRPVELPGFGVVSLAGPGTEATMCADSGCRIPN